MKNEISFINLIENINKIDKQLIAETKKSINVNLTLRNWFIGAYIHFYELKGSDKAEYGDKLLTKLSEKLKDLSNCSRRQLYRYIRFFRFYLQIVGTPSPQLENRSIQIIEALSYSHFDLLVDIDDEYKRSFYLFEAIRSNWSVRELKRQIESLFYERSELSLDKEKFFQLIKENSSGESLGINIKAPYIFEFLGLKPIDIMGESHLEQELINNLEEFLLELGHGFCFEAKQKRILIGKKHYFIDLVFYHRILKCHVLVELKLEGFNHENIGQLNTYLNWYKENEMSEGDNPPIGILLCTEKDHALVKYALAGMDDNLFVSKYQLELPKQEEMQRFIEEKLNESKR